MTKPKQSNTRSGSTPTDWEWRKIRRRSTEPSSAARRALSAVRPKDSVTLTVRYLGGSEAWLEIRARGQVRRVPGHRVLFDLMVEIWGGAP